MGRQKKETMDAHMRLPLGLYRHLEGLAEEGGRSIQEEVTMRLQHSINTIRRVNWGIVVELDEDIAE